MLHRLGWAGDPRSGPRFKEGTKKFHEKGVHVFYSLSPSELTRERESNSAKLCIYMNDTVYI